MQQTTLKENLVKEKKEKKIAASAHRRDKSEINEQEKKNDQISIKKGH
jgi:hypothetical protein